jgi:hypothetical protein
MPVYTGFIVLNYISLQLLHPNNEQSVLNMFFRTPIVDSVRSRSTLIYSKYSNCKFEIPQNCEEPLYSFAAELDDTAPRACIRVKNPPGGQSSGGFW